MSNIDTSTTDDGETAPLSLDEATKALMGEPDAEVSQEDTDAEETTDEAETDDDSQEDDQAEDDGTDADDTTDSDEDEDGQDEYAGGRFAANSARVTLEDGSTVTVDELKRGYQRQGDYTRKTQEVAESRKAAEAETQRVKQLQEQIAADRDLVLTLAQTVMPQKPSLDLLRSDPMGYWEANAAYEAQVEQVTKVAQQRQQEQARQQQETQAQMEARKASEAKRLLEVMPELKDPTRYTSFIEKGSVVMAEKYGLTSEELGNMLSDHRFYPIMRDIMRLDGAQKAKP